MGVPRVMPRTIEIEGCGSVEGAMVNVGNPHFVIFPESEDFGSAWDELAGAGSEDRRRSAVQVWNECGVCAGAGEGMRLRFGFMSGDVGRRLRGTGTCASSAAAMALRGVARELTAMAEGGAQQVVWPDCCERR